MSISEKLVIQKIWGLVLPKSRGRLFLMIGLMFIGAALESVSLGMLIPLIGLMTSPELIMENQVVSSLASAYGVGEPDQLVFVVLGIFVFMFAMAQVYRLWLSWMQTTFLYDLKNSVFYRLYETYLYQPWIFHLNTHSSVITQRVTREVDLLTQSGFAGLLNFIRESTMVLALLGMLFYMTPAPALVSVVLLAPLGWLFQRLSKLRISRWALARQEQETSRLKVIQEGLSIVRELKLSGKEVSYLERLQKHNNQIRQVERAQGFMRQIAKPIFELYAILVMSGAILGMWITGVALSEMAPNLALFAAVVLKVLPSINQIIVSLHGIRYIAPTVISLSDDIHGLKPHAAIGSAHQIVCNNSIELMDVEYSYPGTQTPTLEGVTFTIPRGSFVAFVGGTGEGKSTLVALILGLLTPTKGRVMIDGVNVQSDLRSWQSQIGYVGQNIVLVDDTIRRNIALGIPDNEVSDVQVWKALEAAQISEFVEQLPARLNTIVGEKGSRLSGGERQRLGIARALYREPAVLVLDEATSALDGESQQLVIKAVDSLRGRKTILMITHRLTTIRNCDLVFSVSSKSVQQFSAPRDAGAFSGANH